MNEYKVDVPEGRVGNWAVERFVAKKIEWDKKGMVHITGVVKAPGERR